MKIIKKVFLFSLAIVLVAGCKKSDPSEPLPIKGGVDKPSTVRFVIAKNSSYLNNLTVNNGLLYVLGNFGSLGGVYSTCIIGYNGSSFVAYDSELYSSSNMYAIGSTSGVDYIGGGYINYANGYSKAIGRIYQGTPDIYTASVGSYNGQVFAIENYGGAVYYTGAFNTRDNVVVPPLMKAAGTTISNVGYTLAGQYWSMKSIANYNGTWYVGGSHSNMGNVLQCSGANWTMAGNGFNNQVTELKNINGNLFAAGLMTKTYSSSAALNYVNQLNGTNWVKVGNNNLPGPCNSIEQYNGKVYAAGNGYLYYLDSSNNWISAFDNGVNVGNILKLKSYNGVLYAIERNLTTGEYMFIYIKF